MGWRRWTHWTRQLFSDEPFASSRQDLRTVGSQRPRRSGYALAIHLPQGGKLAVGAWRACKPGRAHRAERLCD